MVVIIFPWINLPSCRVTSSVNSLLKAAKIVMSLQFHREVEAVRFNDFSLEAQVCGVTGWKQRENNSNKNNNKKESEKGKVRITLKDKVLR